MNKLETAQLLARQTAGQQQNTEIKPPQEHTPPPKNNPDQELAWFLQTLEQVYQNTAQLKKKMAVMEEDHWKQIRMLIYWLVIPLTIAIVGLAIIVVFK